MPEKRIERSKLDTEPSPVSTPKFCNYGVQHPLVFFDDPVPQHQNQSGHLSQNIQQHPANFVYQPMPMPRGQMFVAPHGYHPIQQGPQVPNPFYGFYPGYSNASNFHQNSHQQQVPHKASSTNYIKQPMNAQPQSNSKLDYSNKTSNQEKYEHPNANRDSSHNSSNQKKYVHPNANRDSSHNYNRQFDQPNYSTHTNTNRQRFGESSHDQPLNKEQYYNKISRLEDRPENHRGNGSKEFNYSNGGRGNYNSASRLYNRENASKQSDYSNGGRGNYNTASRFYPRDKPRKVVTDANKIELPNVREDEQDAPNVDLKGAPNAELTPNAMQKKPKRYNKKNRNKGNSKHVDKPDKSKIPEVLPKSPKSDEAHEELSKFDESLEIEGDLSKIADLLKKVEDIKISDLSKADELFEKVEGDLLENVNELLQKFEESLNAAYLLNENADELLESDESLKSADLPEKPDDLLEKNANAEAPDESLKSADLSKADDLSEKNVDVEAPDESFKSADSSKAGDLLKSDENVEAPNLPEKNSNVKAPNLSKALKKPKKKAKKPKADVKHSGEFEVLNNETIE